MRKFELMSQHTQHDSHSVGMYMYLYLCLYYIHHSCRMYKYKRLNVNVWNISCKWSMPYALNPFCRGDRRNAGIGAMPSLSFRYERFIVCILMYRCHQQTPLNGVNFFFDVFCVLRMAKVKVVVRARSARIRNLY